MVVDIAFIKEKNEQILNEYKELKREIAELFKDVEHLLTWSGREFCDSSQKKASLWLSIAKHLRKISKHFGTFTSSCLS